ncbi:MAG TPA: segregation/condensation protein A [Gemmatimonadota bacterium]|nr:segregation/condensation protein A [Gemmatimonadota bacterium]
MADEARSGHSVKIESLDFEGPLDLLVYLVQKNEIDIWDIPIALITEQFLTYLQGMTAERLEAAGEFLLMAATLLRIKSQMLLPRPEPEGEEEVEDPRRELVLKILEYQQFREIADQLRDREAAGRMVFPRGLQEWSDEIESGAGLPEPEERVSLSDLLRSFTRLIEEAQRDRVHRLEPLGITIEEKVNFVRERLRRDGQTSFRDLFVPGEPRSHWIVTFVALLEMVREGEVRLRQGERFGEIHVYAANAGGPGE